MQLQSQRRGRPLEAPAVVHELDADNRQAASGDSRRPLRAGVLRGGKHQGRRHDDPIDTAISSELALSHPSCRRPLEPGRGAPCARGGVGTPKALARQPGLLGNTRRHGRHSVRPDARDPRVRSCPATFARICGEHRGNAGAASRARENPRLPSGAFELRADSIEVLSAAAALPFPIHEETAVPEELRLRHRYLDLRRSRTKRNVLLRARVISRLRELMLE